MGRHSQPDGRHSSSTAGRHRADDRLLDEGKHRADPFVDDDGDGGADTAGLRRALIATAVATTVTAGGLTGAFALHHGQPTPDSEPTMHKSTAPAKTPEPVLENDTSTRLSLGMGAADSNTGDAGASMGRVRVRRPAPVLRGPTRPGRGASPSSAARPRQPATGSRAATTGTGSAGTTQTGTAQTGTTAPVTATLRTFTRASTATVPGSWVRPGTGYESSCFCERWGTFHWGVDLAAPFGAPIFAAGDGVVLRAGPATGFGQAVYVQHANGDTTVYGHMEKVLVTAGERVHAGQLIALVGAEGEATGPHLHFEVHKGSEYGQKIDPIGWLAARGVKI